MKAYINTDGLLVVEGVHDELDPTYYPDDVVVTATLYHRVTAAEIAGVTWPITLVYVAGSNGDYQGVIPQAVTVTEGQTCDLKIVLSKDGYSTEIWDKVTFIQKRNVT